MESVDRPGHASIPLRPRADAARRSLSVEERMMGVRVLIVDTDEASRTMLEAWCRSWGMVPVATSGAERALYRVGVGERFDLVFVDGDLPEMDAGALTRRIQCSLPPEECPVIRIATSPSSSADGGAVFASSLMRPLDTTRLLDTVAEVLHRVEEARTQALVDVIHEVRPDAVVWLREEPSMSSADDPGARHPAAGPVLDDEVLADLARELGGLEAVRGLVTALEKAAPYLFEELHRGLQKADHRQVQGAAHTLMTLAGTFGLVAVAEQAAGLELVARDGNLRGGELRLLELMEAYEVAHERLVAHLGGAPPS